MQQTHVRQSTQDPDLLLLPAPRPTPTDNHPPTIWLPERDLLAAATTFFNTHVFGPNRHQLLAASVTAADLDHARAHQEKIEALRRTIDDLELRQERLLRTLEERDDPTGAIFDRLQQRLTALASDEGKLSTLGSGSCG